MGGGCFVALHGGTKGRVVLFFIGNLSIISKAGDLFHFSYHGGIQPK